MVSATGSTTYVPMPEIVIELHLLLQHRARCPARRGESAAAGRYAAAKPAAVAIVAEHLRAECEPVALAVGVVG
jgi:hypothetical protein